MRSPVLVPSVLVGVVLMVLSSCSGDDSPGRLVPDTAGASTTEVQSLDTTATPTDSSPTGSAGAGELYLRPVMSQCQTLALDATATDVTTAVATGDTVVLDENALPIPVSDPNNSQFLPVQGANPPQYCLVGPHQGTGEVFEDNATATVIQVSGWGVTVDLRPGAQGDDIWNALAIECFNTTEVCPTGQLAIELDGTLLSVANVQTENFKGSVQISGEFSESEARNLARVINAG